MQATAYPSPAKSDSESPMRAAHGLGLYNFPPSYTTSRPPSAALYTPSPQPTDAWTHLSTGPSPLMNESGPSPWPTNYEQPTPRSPISWAPQDSHRSSISSAKDMSIFAQAGSPWGSEESSPAMSHSVPMTLAPEYLTTTGNFAHASQYPSPIAPHFDTAAQGMRHHYNEMAFELPETPPASADPTDNRTRKRQKRTKTTPENARFNCELCPQHFSRKYNYTQHIKNRHTARVREHACNWEGCDQLFGRQTDLDRHKRSVHLKEKNSKCRMCGRCFARKDTLIR